MFISTINRIKSNSIFKENKPVFFLKETIEINNGFSKDNLLCYIIFHMKQELLKINDSNKG